MKKILIISSVFPPEVAAAGYMVKELAEELSNRNYSVTVITGWPSYPDGYLFNNWEASFSKKTDSNLNLRIIRVIHFFGNRKKNFNKLLYFFSFAFYSFHVSLFSGSYDTVFCFSTPFFGTWSAWLLAKIKRSKFFYVIFDIHPESSLNAGLIKKNSIIYRIWYIQDRFLCKISDMIITLSQSMKDEIVKRGIEKEKIHIIPFWIDADRITPKSKINDWRAKVGIPNDMFVALYAGTIGYISGADILVEVSKLIRINEKILLLIVGDGVMKDKIMEEAFQNDCTNIRFLPFQPEEELSDMLATADVGLITLFERTGNTSIP